MPPAADAPVTRFALLLAGSGAAALIYEVIWMRRLALIAGAGAEAAALTVGVLFGGLGLGGLLGGGLRPRRPERAYAALELVVVAWVLVLPGLAGPVGQWAQREGGLGAHAAAAALLAGPPALAMGASLPVLARGFVAAELPVLYAANTAGAVLGALAVPQLLLPLLGVRGAELAAAGLAAGVAALAATGPRLEPQPAAAGGEPPVRAPLLAAAALAGGVSMALEVTWARLGAVLLGPSVYTFSWVLAVFLAGVALGAAWGRRAAGPGALAAGLGALGLCAVLGGLLWGQAPLALAAGFGVLGPEGAGLLTPLLAALCMGGAPLASGYVFAQALAQARGEQAQAVGRLYGWNTLAGVVGSLGAGLWALPAWGVQGVLSGAALLAALGAAALTPGPAWRRLLAPAGVGALVLALPPWDGKLYAVGVYHRVSDLADRSPEAVRRFADQGWELLSYEDGRSASVAVGRSTRTGNTWLSINGKVDASTGDDMPTQLLSGQLPVRLAGQARRVLVVGLASGVTAGAVLAEPGVEELTIAEIEPAVVRASRFFEPLNGRPLADPRVRLVADDARAVLLREPGRFDVIISEPSNPWITGVSNLFTHEYWALGQTRLAAGGVFCQWVQLYGLHPDELRSLVRTFTEVFPNTWLFETIPGADALLVAVNGPGQPGPGLPLQPTLGPEALAALGRGAPRNTDDRPWVELAAPRSMHLATGAANEALLRGRARGGPNTEGP